MNGDFMNEDYSKLPFNSDLTNTLQAALKSLESFKGLNSTLNEISLKQTELAITSIRPVFKNLNDTIYTETFNESMQSVIKSMRVLNSTNLKELNAAVKTIYSKEFFQSLNIHLQSTDKLNSELLGTKQIIEDNELFNKLDKPQDPPETPIQSDYSKQLITEVQQRLYNLSHNIIAPFRNKTELSIWITFYITQNVLESNHIPMQIKVIIMFIIAYQLSDDKHN